MTVPVTENSTLLIDHLDFSIKCEGRVQPLYQVWTSVIPDPCDNPATVVVVTLGCGCFRFRCADCLQAYLSRKREIEEAGFLEAKCGLCDKYVSIFDFTVRPL